MSKRHEVDVADPEMRGNRRIVDQRVGITSVPAATVSFRGCRC